MTTVGLAFICKDETDSLLRMLKSCESCFDQRVVAWNGTNPATRAILDASGCEVYRFDWIDEFSRARNFAFARCDCDYIAYLDCDELLVDGHMLHLCLQTCKHDSISLPLDYFFGSIIYWKQRVVRRGSHVWRGALHEELVPTRKVSAGKIKESTVKHLWEYSSTRGERNLRISRSSFSRSPTLKTITDLGQSLVEAGEFREAIQILWRIVSCRSYLDVRMFALQMLCQAAIGLNDVRTLHLASRKMILLAPHRPDGYFKRAIFHYIREEWQQAVESSEKGFDCDYICDGTPIPYEEFSLNPARLYAASLEKVGQLVKAGNVIHHALTTYPDDRWLLDSRQRIAEAILLNEVAMSQQFA